MAKYQEYAEYKDSSIEWLGDVPTDWKCLPIKYLCYVNDGNHGEEYPKESDYTIEELGVPFIRGGNILNFEVTDKDMLYITKEKNTSMRKGRLQVDDILFVNRGDIGKLALISEKHKGANLNSQIAYLRCEDKSINNKFLLYFLASVYVSNLLNSIKMGSVLTQFPIGNILEIKVPLPNSVEQIKIANFLEHETAKIDSLIEKQQQLIQLLKEKRQAVISHAVTKGLNPNVSMKDSGVEWLGEVPEHWEIKRVRHAFDINNNLRTPINGQARLEMDGDFRYYGPTGVLNLINRYNVEGEYFLLGEDGDHFLKFKEQPMTIYVEGNFNVNNHAHLIKGKGLCSTKWGCLYFEHKDLFPWLIKQGVGRYKLQKTVLLDIPVAIPSLDEQEFILSEINKKKNYFSDIEKRDVVPLIRPLNLVL